MSTDNKQNLVRLTWYGRAGDWLKKNQGDIILVSGFILVTLISFGLGYLSAPKQAADPLIFENPATSANIEGSQANESASQTEEKGIFVASRSGKKYHWPWCSWAKNIKEANQVWFKTETEAEAAGFTKCACVDAQAPAGYKE